MEYEVISSTQTYTGFPRYVSHRKGDALKELLQRCGRFHPTFNTRERAQIFISENVNEFDFLGSVSHVISPGTPLNWQALLRYLYEKKIIESPQFFFPPLGNDLPKMHRILLHASTVGHLDGTNVLRDGLAHSASLEESMSKAIGELLERYYLSIFKYDWLTKASYRELSGRGEALDITTLNKFLPSQIQRNKRLASTVDAPLNWIQGATIAGKAVFLPAQMVFWNYDFYNDTREPMLAQPTTSGTAGHFSRDEAILSSLLEQIQRDGFLIYWLNAISPKRIDVTSIKDANIIEMLGRFRRYGITTHFLDTTSDIRVPSATCVLIDEREGGTPVIVVGASTGFDLSSTILHSAYEALSILIPSSQRAAYPLSEPYEPFADGRIGHHERIDVWKGQKMLEKFQFFLSGPTCSPEEFLRAAPRHTSVKEQLKFVLDALGAKGAGYEVYLYEVQNQVLKTLGYHVVRTIVPKLIPLYLHEHLATLDAERLRSVPKVLGFPSIQTLNPLPHPFP